MRTKMGCTSSLIVLFGVLSAAQSTEHHKSLVINGRSADVTVQLVNGRTYVDLETLARVAQGSIGFQGDRIVLTLPGAEPNHPPEIPEREPAQPAGLSRNFVVAGIETIAKMREWATTLAYAIQNGYGVTENWAADYREQAAQSLNLATAAAMSDSDRRALQLLSNEFVAVRHWSDNLVEAKARMDTAKYSTSPNVLRQEASSQKIISCGRFLGAMLGGGEFKDDPSCH